MTIGLSVKKVDRDAKVRSKKSAKGEETTVVGESVETAVPVSAGTPVGFVELGKGMKLSLAFNVVEATIRVSLPVPNLTADMVESVVAELNAVVDDELSKLVEEVGETLVSLGEFRDSKELDYKATKKGRG